MSSTLELDQDDITARLTLDAVTGLVPVFSQRKGITENDIQTKLGPLNSKNGQVGLVLIVLMPKLVATEANTPGAMYASRYGIQIIDWPAVRRMASGGSQISAETMAERVRNLLNFSSFGRGQSLFFDGMEPAPQADETRISYIVYFRKLGADTWIQKAATVAISPQSGAAPQTVTLTCATGGAAIYYTTDGTYPSSGNTTATLYSGAISVTTASTLRAAAELTNYQQSDPSQGVFT